MRFHAIRFLVVAAAAVGVIMPAAASAGPFDPLFHTTSGTYRYDAQSGSPSIFAFVLSGLNAASNQQGIAGTFGNGVFVGTIVNHDYAAAGDTGHYDIQGTVDPTGAAPAVPMLATLDAVADREASVTTFTLDGTVAGQPFHGTTGPVVNPAYGVRG